jgi:hypothetical protein
VPLRALGDLIVLRRQVIVLVGNGPFEPGGHDISLSLGLPCP